MTRRRSLAFALARIGLAVVISTAVLIAVAILYCTGMPGDSYPGPGAPLSGDERALVDELREHVAALSVGIGVRRAVVGDSLAQAEAYVSRQLELAASPLALKAQREPLTRAQGNAANVFIELPGAKSGPWIIIGAHYDSAPGDTPGANDNGTGTAAALALARRLARTSHGLPIRIVLFANEEPPYFWTDAMGSLQHASGCKQRKEDVRAMLSLETMGYYSDAPRSQQYPPPLDRLYPDKGNFIAFVGDLGSRGLVREIIGTFRRHATIPSEGAALPAALPGVGWSDHWSFWQFGYAAVMVTDTAVFRDPNYHEQSDVIANINFDRLARVVSALQRTVEELARR